MGPANGLDPAELTRNADLALCRAKGDVRGSFCFFESEMDAQMQDRRAMEYDMRRGLTAGEFELHYQPVVNLESNEITAFEALARWRHPKNGLLPPSAFIPLAENVGSIIALGEWVMRKACAAAATWPQHVAVAVNLSPLQLRSPGLGQMVVGALNASGLAPGRLELEITETVLLGDNEALLGVLARLRDLGVRIAMDDFGTGYSSLSNLQNFHVDKIKIDRSFVAGAANDAGCLNIVRAITAMAKGLGMSTTAEGVETAEQLGIARAEGCTEVQGFLFGQPVEVGEIETLLMRECGSALSKIVPGSALRVAAG
jgi:EAL domain-containing protein (putative c-di-GMP-specific phosphodiesterase class I)